MEDVDLEAWRKPRSGRRGSATTLRTVEARGTGPGSEARLQRRTRRERRKRPDPEGSTPVDDK